MSHFFVHDPTTGAQRTPASRMSWRSWPPPELLEVPPLYVVDKLRESAPAYWDSKETANCTLLIPNYHPQISGFSSSPGFKFEDDEESAIFSGPLEDAGPDRISQGRRGSEADVSRGRWLTIKAHYEYLCQQSTLLREAFGGASPLHLAQSAQSAAAGQTLCKRWHVAPGTAPNESHLRLVLPLPDPASFPFIIHFFYWGDLDVVKRAVSRKPPLITIEGLWKNARYLNVEELVEWIRGLESESESLGDVSEEDESPESIPPSPSSSVDMNLQSSAQLGPTDTIRIF